MTVVWQSSEFGLGAVEFGETSSLGTRVESSGPANTHAVTLTGLRPATQYFYRVYNSSQPVSQISRFHTNPDSGNDSFQFVVLGDTGDGGNPMRIVADFLNQSNASFALHTGDIIYPNGEEEFYDPNFFHLYAPFLQKNVVYTTPGNHDLRTDDGAPYYSNFHLPANNLDGSNAFYSFDYGNAHFVSLNTNISSAPGSSQATWLEQDLASTTKLWKFAFFHYPPYTAGYDRYNDIRYSLQDTTLRRHLVPLFERYGVNVVFSGHAHSYERTYPIFQNTVVDQNQEPAYTNPRGPIYVVTGGGGAYLTQLDESPFNAAAATTHHVVEVAISDRNLVVRAIQPTGVVIDTFQLTLA